MNDNSNFLNRTKVQAKQQKQTNQQQQKEKPFKYKPKNPTW